MVDFEKVNAHWVNKAIQGNISVNFEINVHPLLNQLPFTYFSYPSYIGLSDLNLEVLSNPCEETVSQQILQKRYKEFAPPSPPILQKNYCPSGVSYTIFFCIYEQFYKNKSLDFGKKCKDKLRAKPDLLSNRT